MRVLQHNSKTCFELQLESLAPLVLPQEDFKPENKVSSMDARALMI
jgi:hypothetical protein